LGRSFLVNINSLWLSSQSALVHGERIVLGCALFVLIFFLPDTLFQRPDRTLTLNDPRNKDLVDSVESIPRETFVAPPMSLSTYLRCLCLLDSERMPTDCKLRLGEVLGRPFRLLVRPSVFLPAVCRSVNVISKLIKSKNNCFCLVVSS